MSFFVSAQFLQFDTSTVVGCSLFDFSKPCRHPCLIFIDCLVLPTMSTRDPKGSGTRHSGVSSTAQTGGTAATGTSSGGQPGLLRRYSTNPHQMAKLTANYNKSIERIEYTAEQGPTATPPIPPARVTCLWTLRTLCNFCGCLVSDCVCRRRALHIKSNSRNPDRSH